MAKKSSKKSTGKKTSKKTSRKKSSAIKCNEMIDFDSGFPKLLENNVEMKKIFDSALNSKNIAKLGMLTADIFRNFDQNYKEYIKSKVINQIESQIKEFDQTLFNQYFQKGIETSFSIIDQDQNLTQFLQKTAHFQYIHNDLENALADKDIEKVMNVLSWAFMRIGLALNFNIAEYYLLDIHPDLNQAIIDSGIEYKGNILNDFQKRIENLEFGKVSIIQINSENIVHYGERPFRDINYRALTSPNIPKDQEIFLKAIKDLGEFVEKKDYERFYDVIFSLGNFDLKKIALYLLTSKPELEYTILYVVNPIEIVGIILNQKYTQESFKKRIKPYEHFKPIPCSLILNWLRE